MTLIEHKIITKKRFSTAVEKLAKENNLSYLDAMVMVVEENSIDEGNVSNLLTDSLKDKLHVEALSLNLVSGVKGNTLPI